MQLRKQEVDRHNVKVYENGVARGKAPSLRNTVALEALLPLLFIELLGHLY